jgi:hypothetical protein
MLNPSDKEQRKTLVELTWLLITLYLLISVMGFPNWTFWAPHPPKIWNGLNAPVNGDLRKEKPPEENEAFRFHLAEGVER